MVESSYFSRWQNNRINFIIDQYGTEFFKGKRILELAPFNGYIGYKFSEVGATVHYIEGRQENVDTIKTQFPMNTIECADLDTPDWSWGSWDIIINFGVYYHLEKHHRAHLINCIKNCNLMFFEAVIFDSDLPEIHFREERGDDQSLSGIGGSPSTSYVENIFKECNVEYTKYTTSRLNGEGHHYDWPDKNLKSADPWARRFWIVNARDI